MMTWCIPKLGYKGRRELVSCRLFFPMALRRTACAALLLTRRSQQIPACAPFIDALLDSLDTPSTLARTQGPCQIGPGLHQQNHVCIRSYTFADSASKQMIPLASKPVMLPLDTNRRVGIGLERLFSAQPQPVEEETEVVKKDSAPSPEDVDREMDNYDKLLEKMQSRSYPPTYEPWSTRAVRFVKTTGFFLVRLPSWLASVIAAPFRKGWWGQQWKHIKEGGKHYWVRGK